MKNARYKEQGGKVAYADEASNYRPLSLHKRNISCPNCNNSVGSEYELCPVCAHRLHGSHCTFCGASMTDDELFCGECGGDTRGVKCPSCGTLSFRSFCPNCNAPVDELGLEELSKASSDPLFKRICALAEKIIEAKETGRLSDIKERDLSPEILALLNRYRSMQDSVVKTCSQDLQEVADFPSYELPHDKNESRISLSDTVKDIPDITSAIEELNALMKTMIPDPGLPPQMQRNYYSARKVAVYRKSIVRETVGWVCNLCGCHHRTPSECARPELGGTWIYQDKEITTKTYE